jgi:hypothetical protein
MDLQEHISLWNLHIYSCENSRLNLINCEVKKNGRGLAVPDFRKKEDCYRGHFDHILHGGLMH